MKAYCVLVGLVFIVVAAPASAQSSLPKEGSGSLTAYITSTWKVLTLGPGQERTQGTYEGPGVATNDAGQGFMHNVAARCLGSWYAEKGAFEEHGSCLYVDRDGDQVYTRYRAEGGPGLPTRSKGNFVGGTGKYSGIQGSTDATRSSLRSTMDGTGASISKVTYSYKLP